MLTDAPKQDRSTRVIQECLDRSSGHDVLRETVEMHLRSLKRNGDLSFASKVELAMAAQLRGFSTNTLFQLYSNISVND